MNGLPPSSNAGIASGQPSSASAHRGSPRTRRAQRLLALLTRQKFLVDQLSALIQRQSSMARDGKAEPLVDLLGKRQELIDRVMSAQSEIAPLLAEAERPDGSMSEHEREQAAALLDAIRTQLASIIERDDHDREAIRAAEKHQRT